MQRFKGTAIQSWHNRLKTPGGSIVRGYCEERSLCDVLRPRNHTDVQVVTDAFKTYTSRKEKNIPRKRQTIRVLKWL